MIRLPEEFIKEIEMFDGLAEALASTRPSTAIRLNRRKTAGEIPPTQRNVAWCDTGRYLESRPQFTLDPALHQGAYYVQDASSMFIGHVIKAITADKPITYLDACAAPGGKTTCALDALPDGSVTVANEAVPARAAVLHENLIKWGDPNVIVTRCDARKLSNLKGLFDIVAADVPCSGEGMMRKEPEAVAQWSRKLIDECSVMQREIVDSLWQCVKPGGYLIYSTCTFNRTENESIVKHIIDDLGGESVAIDTAPEWGIAGAADADITAYRFLPGRIEGEGLFMSIVKKSGEPKTEKKKRGNSSSKIKSDPRVTSMIESPERFDIIAESDRLCAFPHIHRKLLDKIKESKHINLIGYGVTVASVKGRDIVPSHDLAMSAIIDKKHFVSTDVDTETALDYLRCGSVSLPELLPKGHILLMHKGLPLGFVKNLGNRTNNMYPREWRIRHL